MMTGTAFCYLFSVGTRT